MVRRIYNEFMIDAKPTTFFISTVAKPPFPDEVLNEMGSWLDSCQVIESFLSKYPDGHVLLCFRRAARAIYKIVELFEEYRKLEELLAGARRFCFSRISTRETRREVWPRYSPSYFQRFHVRIRSVHRCCLF